MSLISTSTNLAHTAPAVGQIALGSVQRVSARYVSVVTDPDAAAPADLQAQANTVLGMVKWGSLMAVLGILLAMGMISLAADRGHGGGISPEMKSKGMTAVVALVIVGSASAIVNFLA